MKRNRIVVVGLVVVALVALVAWKVVGSHASEQGGGDGDDPSGETDPSSTDRSANGGHGGHHRGLQAPASLSGRVTRAAGGTGVAGATVAIASTDLAPMMNGGDRPPILATTDASGAWSVPQIAPGTYQVAATADGLLPAHRRVTVIANGKATIDLALDAGGTAVTGTVADALGGPIAGARVAMSPDGRMPFGTETLVARTDHDGHYKITLAPGRYSATARHDDYTRSRKTFQLRGEPMAVDFVLAPGASIRGVVVTREGKPVPDAAVRATGTRTLGRGGGGAANTDDQGAFTLTGLGSGAIRLTASARGYASASPTVVELGIGEQLDGIRIVVDRALTIRGRVVRAGKPTEGIPGVMVGVFSMASRQGAAAREPSDDTGAFEVVGVRPASYMLAAFGEHSVPSVGTPIEVVDKDIDGVTLELELGATLSGRVVLDGGGAPPTSQLGLEIAPEKLGIGTMFDAIKALVVHGESDPTGAFTLHNVPAGEFTLVARTEDGRKGTLPVTVTTEDQQGLEVKLEARASIAGKVVDERGRIVPGAHVDVQSRGMRQSFSFGSGPDSGGAMTGTDGRFEVVGLEPGKVTLRVSDERGRIPLVGTGKDKDKGYDVEVTKGQRVTGVTLTVEARDGVIRGTVVDANRQPARDAWVTVQWRDKLDRSDMIGMFWRSPDPIVTADDGTFTVEHLRRGTYRVEVESAKGAARASKDDVKTGDAVTLVLESLGSITGHVTAAGAPVTAFDLGCRQNTNSMTIQFGNDAQSRRFTAADGSYAIERLDPGEYTCTVTADAGTANGKVTVKTSPATLDLALAPWATITGQVVDAVTGKPLPDLMVIASAEGLESNAFADMLSGHAPTTGADGRFVVDKVPTGKGTVAIAPKDATFRHLASREYTATSGQRVDLGVIKLVPPRPDGGGTLGFFPGVANDQLIVADVKDDTPASRAGVTDGDRIVSIDGRAVSDLGADVGRQLLMPGSLAIGQPVQLALERAGKPVAVTLIAEKF